MMLLKKIWWLPALILLWNCNQTTSQKSDLIDFVPADATVIITISNTAGTQDGFETFKRNLRSNSFISGLKSTRPYKFFSDKAGIFDHIKPNSKSLFCISTPRDSTSSFTFITKESPNLFILDSISYSALEQIPFLNTTIQRITIDEESTFTTVIDSVFIASSSLKELENILDGRTQNNTGFKKIAKINNPERLSVILKNESRTIGDSTKVQFGAWTELDMDILPDGITASGVVLSEDSIPDLLSVFKGLIPRKNDLAKIIPPTAKSAFIFTYNDAELLNKNLQSFKDSLNLDFSINPLFESVNEIGVIQLLDEKAIILKSIDPALTEESLLKYLSEHSTFREIPINVFSEIDLFTNSFYPLVFGVNPKFAFQLDEFFVFTQKEIDAQQIITAYKNNSTLKNMPYFENVASSLSSSSSLSIYMMHKSITDELSTFFEAEIASELKNSTVKNYPFAAIQFSYDRDFAHVNLVCKAASEKLLSTTGITNKFSLVLDNELLNGPQFFSNHRTGGKDIVVQDMTNKLYLISEKGKILWTKNLAGPILGSIHEVDILRNGKKQLAFTTKNEFYVIDRNGNSVSPFPLKFKDEITQPLAVFDYDNNRKYRFVITQNKELFMYDAEAKLVKGFTFKKAASDIVLPPQHIRMGNKDYILIAEKSGTLNILNRIGKPRITLSKKFGFMDIPIEDEEGKFVVISNGNTKESISQNGSISSQKLDVTNNYYFTMLGSTKVTLDDNLLRINGKLVELPFGIYSKPKVFKSERSIYISVTETQENKIYVYTSSGNLLQGFPVYGTDSADLGTSTKKGSLTIVVKGGPKEILLYAKD